ncbi:MAG: hypothetical protein KBS79_00905 [Lachnospiraceae bacterium]|nr:hypothetical protein [Candidatus Minthocola equi]
MEFWEKPPIDELYHYGTPRHSGRYPWGSGEDPYQHEKGYGGVVNNLLKAGLKPEELQKWSGSNPYTAEVAFKKKYQELKKSGKSEVDIAKELGMKSTTELRDQLKDYTNKIKNWEIETALAMRHQNIPDAQIAKAIGRPNESSVRTLLADHRIQKKEFASGTVDFLRKQVDAKGMIDVSTGVERELGITAGKFQQAVRQLRSEGYEYYKGRMEQITNPGKFTSMSVLCAPGTAYGDIYDWEKVASVNDYISDDRGDSFRQKWVYPASMDSSRLHIRYKDELDKDGHTGIERDGLIEIRPGVKDLSLGNAQYAQVRILVDGTHYLKGMAIYSNNLPDGVDVVFNTNKPKEKGLTGTLKSIADNIKSDPTNPFGAVLRQDGGQTYYVGDDGKQHLSLINKTREEGDWSDWADKLPSQFLAKQSLQLIRTQLKDTVADKEAEYQEIMHLTNPTVKKNLLNEFAEGCDTDARDLSAIALPHQKYKVLIPIPDMKDGEVYAPHLENGDTVAPVRFPHEGTFQIAKCTVNNENPMAKEYIGNGKNGKLDAIGVNASTAAQLSGADFDGDTAMVIPCDSEKYPVHIDARRYFEELQNFDDV